jgi:hypothetical protein
VLALSLPATSCASSEVHRSGVAHLTIPNWEPRPGLVRCFVVAKSNRLQCEAEQLVIGREVAARRCSILDETSSDDCSHRVYN